MTEAAIIHLSDPKHETTYSLVVHPLTGRVSIKNSFVEPNLTEQLDDTAHEVETEAGAAALRVTYWGGETRRHRFSLTVDGETVATPSLFDDRPGEPFDVEYPLPERLTRDRERIRVGFRTGAGESTGAVFDIRVVSPPSPPP